MTHDADAKRPTGANVIPTMTVEARAKLEARFSRKTRPNEATGCLEWTGGASGAGCGYGAFQVNETKVGAHRVAYVLAHGAIPAGLMVRHKCHNRLCVCAAHLETGTNAENMQDMRDAGRGCTGPGSRRRPMTVEDATGVFGSRILGMPLKDAMEACDVSASVAKAVRGGFTYADAIEAHADEVLAAEVEAAQRASGKAPDQT